MPAGPHSLSLRVDGYEEYRLTVQVTPASTVKVGPTLTAAGSPGPTATPTAVADLGRFQVNSSPSGARVAVDGSYRGTTPLTVPDVPAGMHTVRFTLDGYVEREQSVDLRAGQTATVSANLMPGERVESGTSAFAVLAALGIAAAGIVAGSGRRR